ncbi:hypothetical protein, partial [Pseudobutyrivibrio sp.]|uniref:hypothetical protein n=1 Tax=Pseudobutyrivibrio sp. TaxID=2014367 RepID=UPI00386B48AA
MSKWKEKVWYKKLRMGMYVARIFKETQQKVLDILENLDEEDAEIRINNWMHVINNLHVPEQFDYALKETISYRWLFFDIIRYRGYSFEVFEAARDVFEKVNNDGIKQIYYMLKDSTSEEEFLSKLSGFKKEDYPLTDDLKNEEKGKDAQNPNEEKIIEVCERLKGDCAHVQVILNSGDSMDGMFVYTIKPSKQNNYNGEIYFRTHTYKTIKLSPKDINTVKDVEDGFDPRLKTYYTVGEFYDAVMSSECLNKKISGVRVVGDYENLSRDDFTEERNYPAHIFTYGPLVIEFEDGTNIALAVFHHGAYGLKKNFTGQYEGSEGPNIDANIVFDKMIGKEFVRLEVLSSGSYEEENEDEEWDEDEVDIEKSYPEMDIYEETLYRANFYLNDGLIFELLDYPGYSLDDG